MAISPPSDIVLDVVRAADPLRYSEAAEKLARIGGAMRIQADRFEAFDALEASDTAAAGAPDLRARLASADAACGAGAAEPYRRFESFVLQSFVENMLPDNAEHVFGKGNAGAIWKSFLAEEIGKEIADAGGIGIAEQIAAAYPHSAADDFRLLAGRIAESRMPHASASSSLMAAPTQVSGYVASLELDFADALVGAPEDSATNSILNEGASA